MIRLVVTLVEFAGIALPLLVVATLVWRLRGPLASLVALLERAIVLIVRLAIGAAAGLVMVAVVLGVAAEDDRWLAAPGALLVGAGVLWLTRGWSRLTDGPPATVPISPPQDAAAQARPTTGPRANPEAERPGAQSSAAQSLPLVSDDMRHRLHAVEAALARAARDELGQPAAEWLEFCRRRVPDLIGAAREVYDDAGDAEKVEVALRLAEHLEAIISEAERRLALVLAARRDLFATRAAHAETRVRDG